MRDRAWKNKAFGIATALGIAKLGYFIPYRFAANIERCREPYPWLENWFQNLLCQQFQSTLELVQLYQDILKSFVFNNDRPPEPRWQQDWFPGLDGAVGYSLVRFIKPKRILEIGSGHSTRFFARAVRDEKLSTEMVCVDPMPRADLNQLNVTLLKQPIQTVPKENIPALSPGDMVIVDSSHIAVCGSDVDWVLNRLLPHLPSGIFLHFHDIFLPDPYPKSWSWREYNEQLLVAALLAGERASPVFASHFVRARADNKLKQMNLDWIPLVSGATESSLWLELK